MKHLTRLLLLTTAGFLCVGGAAASTLDSNASTVLYQGVVLSATPPTSGNLTPIGLNQTAVSMGQNPGVWTPAIGSSDWVSFANTSPSSGDFPANGTYTFTATFNVATASSISLSVMADDTTSVYLDGEAPGDLVITAANGVAGTHCTVGQPNCVMVDTLSTFDLSAGMHTLYFGVNQDFDNAMGLDFEATITPLAVTTPEPNSLILLGTGLLAAAAVLRRRLRV